MLLLSWRLLLLCKDDAGGDWGMEDKLGTTNAITAGTKFVVVVVDFCESVDSNRRQHDTKTIVFLEYE